MKAKRLIKSFIYLMPILVFLGNAIFLCTNPYRLSSVPDFPPANVDYNDYQVGYSSQRRGFMDYLNMFVDDGIFVIPADTPLYSLYNDLLLKIGLSDDIEGMYIRFACWFLTYETYAIIICAVLDVIFLIPEFYNKIEDKYIRGGKKRE